MREHDLQRWDSSQQDRHQVSKKEILLAFAEVPAQLWEGDIKTLKKISQATFIWEVSLCTRCKVSTTAPSRSSGSQSCQRGERSKQPKGAVPSSSLLTKCIGKWNWAFWCFCGPVLLSCGSLQLSGPQQRNQNCAFKGAAPGLQRNWRYLCRAGGSLWKVPWASTNTGAALEKQQLQPLTALSLQYWEV